MTHTLSAADAKVRFDELVERIVETGEPVVVTVGGDHAITMIAGVHPGQNDSIDDEIEAIHELVRRDLNGRRLEPDPVTVLRRIRDEE